MSNTASVSFQGGLSVLVQVFANAGYQQTVTITPPSGAQDAAVFTGSGEGNVPLKLTTAGFLKAAPGAGWPSFTTPGNSNQNVFYQVSCTNAGPNPSAVEPNQTSFGLGDQTILYLATVCSEDGGGLDNNDSVTLFTSWQNT